MPLTVEQLKAEFPEFAHTNPGLIAAKIADAYGLLNKSALGDHYEAAVKYQVCHLISLSPSGEFARFKKPDESGATTTYERHLKYLLRSITGPQVL